MCHQLFSYLNLQMLLTSKVTGGGRSNRYGIMTSGVIPGSAEIVD